jgi:hypothetical protein
VINFRILSLSRAFVMNHWSNYRIEQQTANQNAVRGRTRKVQNTGPCLQAHYSSLGPARGLDFRMLSRICQRPRKHFESGGALTKRGTFVNDQNQTILWRSRAERKFLKIWSLYNVGNWPLQSLYYCEKGIFFPEKEGVYSRNTFFVL